MLSFRTDEADATAAQEWAARLGIDRSELLRDALRLHLARLAAEQDIEAWTEQPLTDDELAIRTIADWGPSEDWSDWK